MAEATKDLTLSQRRGVARVLDRLSFIRYPLQPEITNGWRAWHNATHQDDEEARDARDLPAVSSDQVEALKAAWSEGSQERLLIDLLDQHGVGRARDYGKLWIKLDDEPVPEGVRNMVHIDSKTGDVSLEWNDFKTAKTYGHQSEPVDGPLAAQILEFVTNDPGREYLFMTNEAIPRPISRMSEWLKKRGIPSLAQWRRANLTSAVDDLVPDEARKHLEAAAALMQPRAAAFAQTVKRAKTSSGQAFTTYYKGQADDFTRAAAKYLTDKAKPLPKLRYG